MNERRKNHTGLDPPDRGGAGADPEIIAQENYQTLKKESTDRKSQRLSMYEKRIHALARRKGRREKK